MKQVLFMQMLRMNYLKVRLFECYVFQYNFWFILLSNSPSKTRKRSGNSRTIVTVHRVN